MIATGLGEDAFWSSTPRQSHRAMTAAAERRGLDEMSRRWHTWHIAALPMQKKFPTFKDFVKPPPAAASPKQRRQDPVHQIEALKGILSKRKR
jgi:hypothetical protein